MIAKVGPRYGDVASLIRYVYDTGRTDDDPRPRIVAGWRTPAELEPPRRPGGERDFRRLAGLLDLPVAVLGDSGFDRPVWHCVMRAAPSDRLLSDDEWAQIASDVMDRTGLAPAGEEDDAVRWVAIRRGADRIHIVATLARQDRGKPRLWNDWYRVRDACRAAEERYGLQRTALAGSRTARSPSAREIRRARDQGLGEAPRLTLQRRVSTAAGAGSEEEFFALLEQTGVRIRKRSSADDPRQVTGYAVALPGDTARDGSPVWYGGGKLGADLTLPRLRQRWVQPGIAAREYPGSAADAIEASSSIPGSQSERTPGRAVMPGGGIRAIGPAPAARQLTDERHSHE
jgi:hypothetical protein